MWNGPCEDTEHFVNGLERRNPGELEFHQAVQECVETVMPFVLEHPKYKDALILECMTEPDRIVIFRVTWEDDAGNIRANRAWRVRFNNSIGPDKGGMRFHPDVTLSVLKFLGFEQTFKNSLTGLPMGGAKGGANFNPKGKSDREVMLSCQSLMIERHRHIGKDTDNPADDIGVGGREISYLFGQYKRLENRFAGILTGKGLTSGGSLVRTEATGYGCVYFCENMFTAIAPLLRCVGHSPNVCVPVDDVIVCDSKGAIHNGRDDLADYKRELLRYTNRTNRKGTLQDMLVGADVFIGVSKGGLLSADDVSKMAKDSVLLAMANPIPEIMPNDARSGGAAVVHGRNEDRRGPRVGSRNNGPVTGTSIA